MTRCCSPETSLDEAVEILRGGGLVAVPTETVYGLAARALDPDACAAIFEAKGRPLSDPLIVHLPDRSWLERLGAPGPLARRLADAFWPGPLTLVVPRTPLVPGIVTAGAPTVALRLSAHPVLAALLARLGEPLAAPSANRFGRISPTTAAHVLDELDGRIPLILDGGPCQHGIESTIAIEHPDGIEILRPGPLTPADLARFAPASPAASHTPAPGTLPSHYAPLTPLVLDPHPTPRGPRCGLLAWTSHPTAGFAAAECLSPTGNPREAAANLYSALRRLDHANLDIIIAQTPPQHGLASAIANRLAKAAAPRNAGSGSAGST